MDVTDCPCKCHRLITPFGRRLAADCEECNGTGRVTLEGFPPPDEASALANRRVVDPDTPPCCATPQLCGGPHEGCPEAAGARVTAPDSTGDTGTDTAPCPPECPPCVAPADGFPCCPPDDFCSQCR